MIRKLAGAGLAIALMSILSACASTGGRESVPAIPVVSDPAPIVSGTMRPYQIRGRWYRPAEDPTYNEVGMASWYGAYHDGKPTSSGEIFDMRALTAAHKTLPLPGLVEVTNTANGRRAVLRVNDRGPFAEGRIIDLSRAAAEELGLLSQGVGQVRVRYLGRAPRGGGGGQPMQRAEAPPPVVRPTPAPISAPTPYLTAPMPPVIAAPRPVWVQVSTSEDPIAARLIADRLGDRASVDRADLDGRTQFRVVTGPWPDAQAAERERQAVIARGHGDALLISR